MFAITILCVYILLQTNKKQICSLVLAFPCNCCRAAFGFFLGHIYSLPSVEVDHPRNGSSPCMYLEPRSENSLISLFFDSQQSDTLWLKFFISVHMLVHQYLGKRNQIVNSVVFLLVSRGWADRSGHWWLLYSDAHKISPCTSWQKPIFLHCSRCFFNCFHQTECLKSLEFTIVRFFPPRCCRQCCLKKFWGFWG